jgi:hypothetical protein
MRKVGHRYQQGGLEPALYEKQRPGAATVLDDSQKQRTIAMVCSDPRKIAPGGPCDWWRTLAGLYWRAGKDTGK